MQEQGTRIEDRGSRNKEKERNEGAKKESGAGIRGRESGISEFQGHFT